MKLILIGIFLVIALAPSTSAKKQISSDELKQIIHQRSLAGVWYHQPSPFQRSGPEPQIDCLIRLYTGRFWLIDSYLQVINNVSSFLTCVKKCHQVAGCKAVNYIQELAYCELEAFGFVDDPEQLRGTMGELNEMGEPAHADLIDCKILPPGPIEPQTTPPGTAPPASTTVAATTPEPSTAPPTTKQPATTPQPTRPPTTARLPPTTVIPEMYACGKARYPPVITKSPSDPSIDGVEPVPNSWPWTVNILYNGRHRCTGSLLRVSNSKQQSDIVLTAASCLIGNNGAKLPVSGLRVILGSQRASQTLPGQITVGVSSFVQMPRFNTTYFERDVALIKLDTVVPFSSTILPACLAQEGEVFTVDRLCVVTGWGNSMSSSTENILYQLRIATYSASYCARQTVCRVPINNIPCFCGGTADGMGPAQFIDAGSPLTCLIDGNWEQTGVAATINEMSCLTQSTYAPNVFVRISNIRSWIEDTVDDLTSVYW